MRLKNGVPTDNYGLEEAVRDGFLAGYFHEHRRRPEVSFIDTHGTSGGALAAYDEAVAASSDSSYVLRVESVRYLNGQSNRWAGEPLAVRTDLVSQARERQFSRKRSWALGLGTVAAILTVALTTDLLGSGSLGRSVEPPPPGGFNQPWGVAVDGNGKVFVADSYEGVEARLVARITPGRAASSGVTSASEERSSSGSVKAGRLA